MTTGPLGHWGTQWSMWCGVAHPWDPPCNESNGSLDRRFPEDNVSKQWTKSGFNRIWCASMYLYLAVRLFIYLSSSLTNISLSLSLSPCICLYDYIYICNIHIFCIYICISFYFIHFIPSSLSDINLPINPSIYPINQSTCIRLYTMYTYVGVVQNTFSRTALNRSANRVATAVPQWAIAEGFVLRWSDHIHKI